MRSAPPGFYSSFSQRPAAPPQKLDLAYHLMRDCLRERLDTAPALDAQMALSKLHLCALVWEAWTDFGSVGAGRKSVLRKSDKISQGLGHPRLDPTYHGHPKLTITV